MNTETLIEKHEQLIRILEHVRFYQTQIRYNHESIRNYEGFGFNSDYQIHSLEIHEKCLKRWEERYQRIMNEITARIN